jgi:hypothetical protein
MDEEVEASRGNAPHVVAGGGTEIVDAIARLLEKLAPRGILEGLVALDVPAGQEPRAREWAGGLPDEQDAPGVVDAGNDGADAGPVAADR